MDARVLNSESDGQHLDPDVQRQLLVGFEDTDGKLRTIARKSVRGNMVVTSAWDVECFSKFDGIYRINPTTIWELRSEPWSDEHPGMTVTVQPRYLVRLPR